jgi:hypothetical protein
MVSRRHIRLAEWSVGATMALMVSVGPSAADDTATQPAPSSIDCRFDFSTSKRTEDGISRPIEAFPDLDVFRPPLADVKQPRFFASYQAVQVRNPTPQANLGSSVNVGSVGFGENFGLLGQRNGCDGWQVGILGGVFAQFNLDSPSKDLINADYVIGIPFSWRSGLVSTRVRFYHQSSHLGDEFLLGNPGINREGFSFEEFEALLSLDTPGGWGRVYAGGGYLVHTEPQLNPIKIQWGLELRGPAYHTPLYGALLPDLRIIPVLGADFKSFEELHWLVNTNVVAGVELYRGAGSRRFRVLLNYYYGYNPYGQFFRQKIETVGIGAYLEF